MFIPWWFFVIAVMVMVVIIGFMVGRSKGDYDFVSPILGIGIILIGTALGFGVLAGFFLKGCGG